jgi:sulfatase maturation enzyme AslB (radical SAM superfamily)
MKTSIRGYARHRGVSEGAVRKAINTGRITIDSNGRIDVTKADNEWAENTDQAKQNMMVAVDNHAPKSEQNSYTKIKTAHELYKAQLTQLALQEKKGQLIQKEMVKAQVGQLSRQVRDSWMNWPSRISALMAAELEIEEHQLHIVLERYVREHLNDIGDGKLNFD